jgi:hypothetical protein
MYRLLEINKTDDKESQSIYPFDDFTAMEAEYETKLGAWMKNESVQAELLVMLDGSLNTIEVGRVGEAELSPRLIEVKTTETEEVTVSKYDSNYLVSANFHSKLGAAMKNEVVTVEILKGVDGNGAELEHRSWIRPVEPTPEPEEETEPTE